MKKVYFFLSLLMIAGFTMAQVDPGTANLKHHWTFDTDLTDVVGGVTGWTNGVAEVRSGSLVLEGGYADLDAAALAINTNTELTFSAWFTSTVGANPAFHFLFYFGDTVNGMGEGGFAFTGYTPLRGQNRDYSRAIIEAGTGELGVNGHEYHDGQLHHVAYTIKGTELKLYLDGALQGTVKIPVNAIQNLSNASAWFGRGGWWAWDANWQGSLDDFRIYDLALTGDNIQFLYNEQISITPVAPSSGNLKHQWTYDDGTATDLVGGLTTTLLEGAELQNQALDLTGGGYAEISTDNLNINTYPDGVSIEMWFTSTAGWEYYMPFYFGATSNPVSGGGGDMCLAYTAVRGGEDRGSVFMKNGGVEIAVPTYPIVDRKLRHVVAVVNNAATTLSFYMDGILVGTKTDAIFTTSTISNQLAWLGRGGWTDQPRWTGLIHKLSIYDTPLTLENIKYLNNEGAEDSPLLVTSISGVGVSPNFTTTSFTVTGIALTDPITVTAPAGISVDPVTIPADAQGTVVTVTYDGTTAVDGVITLTSGTATKDVLVRSTNTTCFNPLYTVVPNLIPDPECNSLSNFIGWGARRVVNNVAEPENVFCGPNAIEVGNGVSMTAGSLDVSLDGKLQPNRTYRVRAMIKTVGGENRITIRHAGTAEGLDVERKIDTNGEWIPLDFTFTAGASFPEPPFTFFNHHDLNTGYGYIDNWEMYDITDNPPLSIDSEREVKVSLVVKNKEVVVLGSGVTEVSIYSITGNLVKKVNSQIVNLSELPVGVYIADVISNGVSVKTKFILK